MAGAVGVSAAYQGRELTHSHCSLSPSINKGQGSISRTFHIPRSDFLTECALLPSFRVVNICPQIGNRTVKTLAESINT